jgi:hypothetical protein
MSKFVFVKKREEGMETEHRKIPISGEVVNLNEIMAVVKYSEQIQGPIIIQDLNN